MRANAQDGFKKTAASIALTFDERTRQAVRDIECALAMIGTPKAFRVLQLEELARLAMAAADSYRNKEG